MGRSFSRDRDSNHERYQDRQTEPRDADRPARHPVRYRHKSDQERRELRDGYAYQQERPGHRRRYHDRQTRLFARGRLAKEGAHRPAEDCVQNLPGRFRDERQQHLQESDEINLRATGSTDRLFRRF
jgi:hypothetical protein